MSQVKIKITRRGVYDKDGKRIPVGTVLTFDKEPVGWANKYELLSGGEEPQEGAELHTADKDAEKARLVELYRELSGKEPAANWGIPKLTTEVEKLQSDDHNS